MGQMQGARRKPVQTAVQCTELRPHLSETLRGLPKDTPWVLVVDAEGFDVDIIESAFAIPEEEGDGRATSEDIRQRLRVVVYEHSNLDDHSKPLRMLGSHGFACEMLTPIDTICNRSRHGQQQHQQRQLLAIRKLLEVELPNEAQVASLLIEPGMLPQNEAVLFCHRNLLSVKVCDELIRKVVKETS